MIYVNANIKILNQIFFFSACKYFAGRKLTNTDFTDIKIMYSDLKN